MEISKDLARELILDHFSAPGNKLPDKKVPKGKYVKGHTESPSCIDKIDGYILVEKGKVKDAKFGGVGCAICTSSTDILVDEIIGKTISQAKKIITNYLNMVLNKKFDEKLVGKLIVYKDIHEQANRVKCAMTGIQAIQKAIENYEKE